MASTRASGGLKACGAVRICHQEPYFAMPAAGRFGLKNRVEKVGDFSDLRI
jgi:hypothetical protein